MDEQPKERFQKLKTLNESDREALERSAELRKKQIHQPNGIACPKCGEELVDVDRSIVMTTNYLKTPVSCPSCRYNGSRII